MKGLLSIMCFTLLFFPKIGASQNIEGMLIAKIEGNQYIRSNYDESGKLKSYQTIEVGVITKTSEKVEAKMTVVTYDENNNMKGASQTVISCDPGVGEVIMGIFPFAGGARNRSLRIVLPIDQRQYPAGWQQKEKLDDFTFLLKIKGGAAGFFGTKSKVSITERRNTEIGDGLYRISGKMTLKAFVAGIKITTFTYDYWEEINIQTGIVRQKFVEENGNYFTVESR